ncbi:MAG: hypothetical protein RLO52_41305 [Sandaracinaceae bacterium]
MNLGTTIVLCLFGAFATSVILRLRRRGRAAFDGHLTPRDRRLVGATAFYLVVPSLALLAQGAQLGLLHAMGARVTHAETWVYWGFIEADGPPALRAAGLAASPLLLIVALLVLVGWTRLRPSRAAVNHLRLESARLLTMIVFGVQPVVSLLSRRGAHWELRELANGWREGSGDAGLLVFGVIAAFAFWRLRSARGLWALASPLHDATDRAKRALERDAMDADALRALGAAQLAMGHPDAEETLTRAWAVAPEDPRVALLLGRAAAMRGDASEASEHLRRAGQLLEATDDDPALFFEIALALGAARLQLGDAEGAILTAEAAREAAPRDLRAAIVLADALALDGQSAEARRTLEAIRDRAAGALRRQIDRRLRGL